MASSQITDEMRKFLIDCNLLPCKEKLHDEGISRVEDIEDVTISTLKDLGLTDTQAARLKRKFNEAKAKQGQTNPDSQLESKLSSQVEHFCCSLDGKKTVVLPKGFFNKEGGKIIRLSSSSLQEKYNDLWNKFPSNLKQKLSNSFILDMCQAMEPRFKTIRLLTDWARKEREKLLDILLALHPVDKTLGQESKYFMKKSLKWQLVELQRKYPVLLKVDSDLNQDANKFTQVDEETYCVYLSDLNAMLEKAKVIDDSCKLEFSKSLNGTALTFRCGSPFLL